MSKFLLNLKYLFRLCILQTVSFSEILYLWHSQEIIFLLALTFVTISFVIETWIMQSDFSTCFCPRLLCLVDMFVSLSLSHDLHLSAIFKECVCFPCTYSQDMFVVLSLSHDLPLFLLRTALSVVCLMTVIVCILGAGSRNTSILHKLGLMMMLIVQM